MTIRMGTIPRLLGLSLSFVFLSAHLGNASPISLGTASKVGITYSLPLAAAEERGIWKEVGLEVKWVATGSGTALFAAVAAGSIHVGMNNISANILMTSRGIPALMVARLGPINRFFVWVRSDSRFTRLEELRGAKIGVTRLGALTHAYAKTMLRALGLERDVRIVASGGDVASLAAVRSGALDASVSGETSLALAEYNGIVRRLFDLSAYVPQEVVMAFATRQFIEQNPDGLKRLIAGLLQSVGFVIQNPGWTKEKLNKQMGWPEPLAEKFARINIPEDWRFRPDGKINVKEMRAMQEFMIANELVSKERISPLERLYSAKFVPAE